MKKFRKFCMTSLNLSILGLIFVLFINAKGCGDPCKDYGNTDCFEFGKRVIGPGNAGEIMAVLVAHGVKGIKPGPALEGMIIMGMNTQELSSAEEIIEFGRGNAGSTCPGQSSVCLLQKTMGTHTLKEHLP